MKKINYQSFYGCVSDLLEEKCIQDMENISQHTPSVNCLGHCLFVSYLSFRLCRLLGLRSAEAARGALMHDMFLYDQHQHENRMKHLVTHPAVALKNAEARFELSDVERDAIYSHMWPITLRSRPQSHEAAVVCLMDKVCAVAEVTHLYHLFNMQEKLHLGIYQPDLAAAL
ncbi:MAG: HD domain-containing protein [Oscillospiraceae bacterium]